MVRCPGPSKHTRTMRHGNLFNAMIRKQFLMVHLSGPYWNIGVWSTLPTLLEWGSGPHSLRKEPKRALRTPEGRGSTHSAVAIGNELEMTNCSARQSSDGGTPVKA